MTGATGGAGEVPLVNREGVAGVDCREPARMPAADPPGHNTLPTVPSPFQGFEVQQLTPSRVGALVRAARPRQWLKNLLVFAAPGAAGVLTDPSVFVPVTAAFMLFCLASSGIYLLNDVFDVEADRRHPKKRYRPVAAGTVTLRLARVCGVVLVTISLAAGLPLANGRFTLLVAVYATVAIAYTVRLKHEPVFDIAVVASGFILRAVAGGIVAAVPLSNWFLIVASFGSLFVVAGKRHAEHVQLGEERGAHRATLDGYSVAFLAHVRSLASGVAIVGYCLWAFDKAEVAGHGAIWFQLSVVPFVLAMLRYALLLDRGDGGAPEDLVLGDRTLQVLGAVWAAAFALGVYVV